MKKVRVFLKGNGIRLLVLIAVFIFCTALFSGCGVKTAEVNTELTISKDFAGVRRMTLDIPQKTFDKYISASWGETAALLKNGCPEQLSCEVSENNALYTIVFELEFDSLKDYEEKAGELLDRAVDISVDSPDNVFASGIVIHEDFSSIELLSWLPVMINERGYISLENADKLLVNGKNTAVYNGDVYKNLDEYISISDLKALTINSVTINTLVNTDRTFNREIIIDLPSESIDENGDAIREYLEGNLTENAEGVWNERSRNCIFTASIKKKSIEELQEFTARLLDDERCVTNYKDSAPDGDVLDIVLNYNEELFFYAFTSEGVAAVPVKYNFDIEDLDKISVLISTDGAVAKSFEVEDLDGYTTLADGCISSMNMQVSMSRRYEVDHIKADTVVNGDDDIIRSFVLELSELPTEFEQKIITSRFVTEDDDNIIKGTQVSDGRFCLTVKLSGSESGVSSSFRNVFGTDGELCFKLNEKDSGKTFDYNESLDFSDYMPVSEDVILTYNLRADGYKFNSEKMKLSASAVKNLKDGGKSISCNAYGTGLSIGTGGERSSNVWIWISAASAIVIITAAAVLIIAVRRKSAKIRDNTGEMGLEDKESADVRTL